MNRENIASSIIKYLEDRINCKNLLKFINQKIVKDSELINTQKLLITNIPVSFEIIKYNESDESNESNESDKSDGSDETLKRNMFDTFDFITESNYTGFAYFPYLYGVLDCHYGENSKIYVFHEYFEGNILQLINQIQHVREWYDIVFQMIMINYFLMINHLQYASKIEDHWYKKLPTPDHKEYEINGHKLSLIHQYTIVAWSSIPSTKLEENINIDHINVLVEYLDQKREDIKIPPSGKIIKLLHEIINDPINTFDIVYQYYKFNE